MSRIIIVVDSNLKKGGIMLNQKEWKLLNNCTPGFYGEKRNEAIEGYNNLFGDENWILGWIYGENILDFEETCLVYEDSYFEFLKQRVELVDYLCHLASDVYDDDPSNVEAGYDYLRNGRKLNHIQDIAIKRVIKRLGRKFQGEELVQIRSKKGKYPISMTLSPGQVPFHRTDLITTPDNYTETCEMKWWLPETVEDFYQRNKRLFLKR